MPTFRSRSGLHCVAALCRHLKTLFHPLSDSIAEAESFAASIWWQKISRIAPITGRTCAAAADTNSTQHEVARLFHRSWGCVTYRVSLKRQSAGSEISQPVMLAHRPQARIVSGPENIRVLMQTRSVAATARRPYLANAPKVVAGMTLCSDLDFAFRNGAASELAYT
jgi:hypothetical protein